MEFLNVIKMRATANQLPEAPQPPPKQKLLIPQRDTVTNMQINTLLQVAAQLTVVLVNPMRDPTVPAPELDGGVQSAAESAFIKCCGCLEEILSDKDRWSMQSQNTLEKSLDAAYTAQILYYNEQTALTHLMQTPHHLYKPDLAPTNDGRYVAFVGRLDQLETAIYGIGDSPSAAMTAFDEVFNGRIPDDMLHYLAMRQAAAESGQTLPPFPHQPKQNNESKKLDKRRNRKTNSTQRRRKNDAGNS
jgi:hypothetical protein